MKGDVTDYEHLKLIIKMGNEYMCTVCSLFIEITEVAKHLLSHVGAMPMFCEVCDETFISEPIFKNHKSQHFQSSINSLNYPCIHQCNICDVVLPTMNQHASHYLEHLLHVNIKCYLCNVYFSNFTDCLIHQHSHEHNLSCKLCGYVERDGQLLLHHVTQHSPDKYFRNFFSIDSRVKFSKNVPYKLRSSKNSTGPQKEELSLKLCSSITPELCQKNEIKSFKDPCSWKTSVTEADKLKFLNSLSLKQSSNSLNLKQSNNSLNFDSDNTSKKKLYNLKNADIHINKIKSSKNLCSLKTNFAEVDNLNCLNNTFSLENAVYLENKDGFSTDEKASFKPFEADINSISQHDSFDDGMNVDQDNVSSEIDKISPVIGNLIIDERNCIRSSEVNDKNNSAFSQNAELDVQVKLEFEEEDSTESERQEAEWYSSLRSYLDGSTKYDFKRNPSVDDEPKKNLSRQSIPKCINHSVNNPAFSTASDEVSKIKVAVVNVTNKINDQVVASQKLPPCNQDSMNVSAFSTIASSDEISRIKVAVVDDADMLNEQLVTPCKPSSCKQSSSNGLTISSVQSLKRSSNTDLPVEIYTNRLNKKLKQCSVVLYKLPINCQEFIEMPTFAPEENSDESSRTKVIIPSDNNMLNEELKHQPTVSQKLSPVNQDSLNNLTFSTIKNSIKTSKKDLFVENDENVPNKVQKSCSFVLDKLSSGDQDSFNLSTNASNENSKKSSKIKDAIPTSNSVLNEEFKQQSVFSDFLPPVSPVSSIKVPLICLTKRSLRNSRKDLAAKNWVNVQNEEPKKSLLFLYQLPSGNQGPQKVSALVLKENSDKSSGIKVTLPNKCNVLDDQLCQHSDISHDSPGSQNSSNVLTLPTIKNFLRSSRKHLFVENEVNALIKKPIQHSVVFDKLSAHDQNFINESILSDENFQNIPRKTTSTNNNMINLSLKQCYVVLHKLPSSVQNFQSYMRYSKSLNQSSLSQVRKSKIKCKKFLKKLKKKFDNDDHALTLLKFLRRITRKKLNFKIDKKLNKSLCQLSNIVYEKYKFKKFKYLRVNSVKNSNPGTELFSVRQQTYKNSDLKKIKRRIQSIGKSLENIVSAKHIK